MVVTPALTLNSRFAVPFSETRLDPCAALNRDLATLFLARENDTYRNPTPSHIPQAEMFESRFNLFHWNEACVQQLREFMLNAVARAVLQATGMRQEDLASLKLQNHTWFHITRFAGSFVAHNHPLASWSAVYCVRAGEQVADQPDSGLLRFFDPRSGANTYRDPANAKMRPEFALGSVETWLTEGQLVIFPSYIFHEVAPFFGRDTRITVATNCWFS